MYILKAVCGRSYLCARRQKLAKKKQKQNWKGKMEIKSKYLEVSEKRA